MPGSQQSCELAVVGAGIVGLAFAADALERGVHVVVLERDQRAAGASVRNFGHVGATPHDGEALAYARVARERWIQLGEKAGFAVQRCGSVVVARSAHELAVLEEFAAARGSEEVRLLTAAQVRAHFPVATSEVTGGAHLPLDLRVNPPDAIAALSDWLAASGADIRYGTHAGEAGDGVVRTARGPLRAQRVVCAVGHDVDRLFPAVAQEAGLVRCKLHMLDVELPGTPAIEPVVLTGLSLLRYGGFTAMPAAAELAARARASAPELLAAGMNLMCAQRPDGTVTLGDTHHYAVTLSPFDDERVSELLLREGTRLLGGPLTVRRRWRGVYAHCAAAGFLVCEPQPHVAVVSVTCGLGMTTAFGLAPAVLDKLL